MANASTPLDTALLATLSAEIEAVRGRSDLMADLQKRLVQEQGLKLVSRGGTNHATMAGVKASATESKAAALRNWANAARRAILNAKAA